MAHVEDNKNLISMIKAVNTNAQESGNQITDARLIRRLEGYAKEIRNQRQRVNGKERREVADKRLKHKETRKFRESTAVICRKCSNLLHQLQQKDAQVKALQVQIEDLKTKSEASISAMNDRFAQLLNQRTLYAAEAAEAVTLQGTLKQVQEENTQLKKEIEQITVLSSVLPCGILYFPCRRIFGLHLPQ